MSCENCGIPADLAKSTFAMLGPSDSWQHQNYFTICGTCKDLWFTEAPTVELVRSMRSLLYTYNGVGCCLHIALDDFNLETHHVEFCIEYAEESKHGFCSQLGRQLLKLTLEERYAVCGLPPEGPKEYGE